MESRDRVECWLERMWWADRGERAQPAERTEKMLPVRWPRWRPSAGLVAGHPRRRPDAPRVRQWRGLLRSKWCPTTEHWIKAWRLPPCTFLRTRDVNLNRLAGVNSLFDALRMGLPNQGEQVGFSEARSCEIQKRAGRVEWLFHLQDNPCRRRDD